MTRAIILPFCFASLALSFAGCRHAAPATSFQFVSVDHPDPPIDARTIKLKVGTNVFSEATPIEPLALPVYPPAALAAHVGAVTFAVRISVSKEGRVVAINPSLADVSVPTRFNREFHQAIESALAQWLFEPAQLARLEPAKDGRPVMVSSVDTETYFDIAFTFSPSGTVSTVRKTK